MAEVDLDEKDFHILQKIDKKGEIDVSEVSEELDISTSTVYYRLEKYREKGILKEEITQLDAKKLGLDITAITEIDSQYGPGYEEIGERLTELSGVHKVYFMLGEKSFVIISHLRDHSHLQEFIDEIIQTEGVEHSATSIVLKEIKDESRLLVNYDTDDLKKIFDLD